MAGREMLDPESYDHGTPGDGECGFVAPPQSAYYLEHPDADPEEVLEDVQETLPDVRVAVADALLSNAFLCSRMCQPEARQQLVTQLNRSPFLPKLPPHASLNRVVRSIDEVGGPWMTSDLLAGMAVHLGANIVVLATNMSTLFFAAEPGPWEFVHSTSGAGGSQAPHRRSRVRDDVAVWRNCAIHEAMFDPRTVVICHDSGGVHYWCTRPSSRTPAVRRSGWRRRRRGASKCDARGW